MRILHAARNIADHPGALVRALRRQGHEAEVWEYGESPFGFPVDRTITIPDRDPRVLWGTFMEAIEHFDVLHFHFGRSLFPNHWGGMPPFWDLPVYRILGKRVFFTFHGSDARIRRIHEEINPRSYYASSDIEADDDRTEKTIEVIRTYADRMFVVSVDYLPFVPEAEFLPRVIDLALWPEQPPSQRERPVVLHVPSRRGTKGTESVVEGMRALEAEGIQVDFRLLEGVSHEEARAAIRDADIVVDNLVTGDYETVSLEAMAAGRVAVADIQERVAAALPDAPVYSANTSDFVPRMRALIADLALRRRLAERGRPYVARVHDAEVIAGRLLEIYAADPRPVPVRSFPDWLSLEDKRKIERLDTRIARLEQDLARSRLRESDLRGRLGLDPRSERSGTWKDLVPSPLRLFLRRQRARLRDARSH
jgi:glycosyltransferase involved in cell wall biosynthesis